MNRTTLREVVNLVLGLNKKGSKLDIVESALVVEAFKRTQGNLSAAARMLGCDRKRFERKLAKAQRLQ